MNFFVTGVSGFIGQHFILQLRQEYPNSRIFSLTRKPSPHLDSLGVVSLVGNLKNVAPFESEISSCDVFIHLGGIAQFTGDFEYFSENTKPVQDFTAIFKKHNKTPQFIFISTIGAFDREPRDRLKKAIERTSKPNPRSRYGESKLKAENVLKDSGIPYTIIRPSWVYGRNMRPDSHVCAMVKIFIRKPFVRFFSFPGKVSLVHVEDLCAGILGCIKNPKAMNQTFFVSSEQKSLGEILLLLAQRMGLRTPLRIPIFDFGLCKFFHSWLPVQLVSLFADYLVCDGKPFWEETGCAPRNFFDNHVEEILDSQPLLRGHTVITGANSGIGLSLTQLFLEQGKKVVALDIQTNKLNELTSSNLTVFSIDLSKRDEVERAAKELVNLPISSLINNAGIGFRGDFSAETVEQISRTIDINNKAPLLLTHYLLNHLRRCGSTIVNITSTIAIHPLPHMSVYAASKAFLRSWSLALAIELKDTNRVITFAPSGTDTNFQRASGILKTEKQRLLSAPLVATRIERAMRGNRIDVSLGMPSLALNLSSYLRPIKVRLALWAYLFRAQR